MQAFRHKAPRRAAVSYAHPDIPLHQGEEGPSNLDIPRRGLLHLGDDAGKLYTITPTRKGCYWHRGGRHRCLTRCPASFGGGWAAV